MKKLLELMALAIEESENSTVHCNWSVYYLGGASNLNVVYYPKGLKHSKNFERTQGKLNTPDEIAGLCAFIQDRLLFPPTS